MDTLTYFIVRGETREDFFTRLFIHVNVHLALESIQQLLSIGSGVTDMQFSIVDANRGILHRFLDPVTCGIPAGVLDVIRVVMVVGDRLLAMIVPQLFQLLIRLLPAVFQKRTNTMENFRGYMFIEADMFHRIPDEQFHVAENISQMIQCNTLPSFGLAVEKLREKYMVVIPGELSTPSLLIQLRR